MGEGGFLDLEFRGRGGYPNLEISRWKGGVKFKQAIPRFLSFARGVM
jgi:hypothetical protein